MRKPVLRFENFDEMLNLAQNVKKYTKKAMAFLGGCRGLDEQRFYSVIKELHILLHNTRSYMQISWIKISINVFFPTFITKNRNHSYI